MKNENIERAFQDHATRIASGYAAMGPAPTRHSFNLIQTMTEPTEPEPTPEPAESTDQRVLRESGILGKYDLRFSGLADVTKLTGDILTKKDKARLAELQVALDRLASEIDIAARATLNPYKIVAAAPLGELPSDEAMAVGIAGDEGRLFRKKTAKAAAVRFFEEECRALVLGIYGKAAAILEAAILERHKAEQAAFEKFSMTYYDDDSETIYRPSPGLIRMAARRRQLLDSEIPPSSPPSLRSAFSGIVDF
jgi:hypothetical protein